jgi:outer membrane receptor protein involved in Fe transport
MLLYLAAIGLESDTIDTEILRSLSGTVIDENGMEREILILDTATQRQINDRDSLQLQAQFSTRQGRHELVIGTSHYLGDNDVQRWEDNIRSIDLVGGIIPPSMFPIIAEPVRLWRSTERNYHNLYFRDKLSVGDGFEFDLAVFFDHLKNSEPLVNESWSDTEINPRLGAIYRPNDKDFFRFAAFRYLQPFFSAQLAPTEVAGLTIFRNTQEGALVKELDLAWEREWSSGFAALTGFLVNSEVEGRPVPNMIESQGSAKFDEPIVFVGTGRLKGIELGANQLLGDWFGLTGRYRFADVEDDWLPDADRLEHRAELELRFVHATGWSAGLLQGYRDMKLRNRPEDENFFYTDVELAYQLPGRLGTLSVVGKNVFDSNFNWVTDRFTLGGVIPRRNWLFEIEMNF